MTDLFLGIDIGTTAIKFGIIDEGQLIHQQSTLLNTYTGDRGERYQKAEELQAALCSGIQALPQELRIAVRQVSFSTAMHSCMPVVNNKMDKIYLWSDAQAEAVIEKFKQDPKAQQFYLKTGTPIHPMSTFAKILFFKEKAKYPATTQWYGLKELVMKQFVGEYLIDYSTASATGLFNLKELNWDEEILNFLGISEKDLAKLTDTTDFFAILPECAALLGLSTEVKVYTGASDGCLAAFASYMATGITNSLTIGTSAAVRKVTQNTRFDISRQNFCYYLNPQWFVTGAPSNNGGCVLEWAGKTFFDSPASLYAQLPELLAASSLGASGLRFHPYINGERAPYWSSGKKAELKYLSIQHTRADILRSLVEGVLMNVRQLTEMVGVDAQLSLSGGFFHTEILQQLTADILNKECWLSEVNEPIFGLYFLIFQKPAELKFQMKRIIGNAETKQQYDFLSKT